MTTQRHLFLCVSLPIVLCCAISTGATVPVTYEVMEFAPTSSSESNFAENLNNLGVGVGRMFSGSSTADRGLIFRDGVAGRNEDFGDGTCLDVFAEFGELEGCGHVCCCPLGKLWIGSSCRDCSFMLGGSTLPQPLPKPGRGVRFWLPHRSNWI